MAEKVLTAPLAIININGQDVGKIKNFRASESYQRADVRGISELISQEKPITTIQCTFTASSYMIDLSKLGNIDNPFMRRIKGMTLKSFVDTILLTDSGVSIKLYRKTGTADSSGIVVRTKDNIELIGQIDNAFLDSQSFDISEGQISGSDLSGTYLSPILL